MQPVQPIETYHAAWVQARGLADAATLAEAQRRLAAAPKPDLTALLVQGKAPPPSPTLLSVLEEMGRLTREQREQGERECAQERGSFMNWRAKTMEEEQAKRRGPKPG